MGSKKSTRTKLTNIISLIVVFVMMAAVAVQRDGTLFGHRITGADTDTISGITHADNGDIVINTTAIGRDIRGYNGNVPLEIRLNAEGKIVDIHVLANNETPDFLQHVLESGLLGQWVGKTASAVLDAPDADAVSGATYTSTAIIANVRAGLSAASGRTYTYVAKESAHDFHHPAADTTVVQKKAEGTKKADAQTDKPDKKTTDKIATTSSQPHDFVINTTETGSNIQGFNGPVPIEVAVSARGRITGIKPLANDETPAFFKRVTNAALTDTFVGMTVRQALRADMPDAVSGATYSSKALIENMRLAFGQARDTLAGFDKAAKAAEQPKITEQKVTETAPDTAAKSAQALAAKPDTTKATDTIAATSPDNKTEAAQAPAANASPWSWQLIVALCFAVFATLAPLRFKGRRWRMIQLALNVAVLGILCGKFLSFSLMVNILSSGTQWVTGAVALVMLFAAFVMPLFGRPNHYCMWVCPFGSAQELMGRLSKRKWRIGTRATRVLAWVRRALWAVLMILMWCGAAFIWMDYEPFALFIPTAASVAVIITASAFLVLSIFVNRPYCMWICPTGTTFRAAQNIRKP